MTFRGDVYVDTKVSGAPPAVRGGRFVLWMEASGDALAVVQTAWGRTHVRWSMIEGIDSPYGLPVIRRRDG